jgi:hypothetical protein
LGSNQSLQFGICYECCTKDNDSSKKPVYRCDVCGKWFCELHLKPKLPYFVDWETQFDVQGNPAVKALFYSEYGRKDGHSDFVYLRKTVEAIELEKKNQNSKIQENIDKMMEFGSSRSSLEILISGKEKETYQNGWGQTFTVPYEVYSNKIYRDKLHGVNTQNEVNGILNDFYFNGKTLIEKEKQTIKLSGKKKHWWQ